MTDILTEAYREAIASCPDGGFILETLEIVTPSIADEFDVPIPLRLVRDDKDWDLTLEADAPLDPLTQVTFQKFGFAWVPPGIEEGRPGQAKCQIDGIGAEAADYLEKAIAAREPIHAIFREFLPSDPATVQRRIQGMRLKDVKIMTAAVTATLYFGEVERQPFPNARYTPADFPTLAA